MSVETEGAAVNADGGTNVSSKVFRASRRFMEGSWLAGLSEAQDELLFMWTLII
jgi:hypothetical protein